MKPMVRHVMNRDPVTITDDYTVRETAQMMIDFGLETLIVTTEEEILGAVTYRDILEYLILPKFDPDAVTIGEITDETVILVRPNTSLGDAAEIMLETDRSTLPVVENDLVGYISYTEILKLVHNLQMTAIETDEPFKQVYYVI